MNQNHSPYQHLERIFHEPNRLAIMSALGGSAEGLTFRDLKEQCNLTDGNLSRHLKALEEAHAVEIRKTFVGARPRTTVYLTSHGRSGFVEYLQNLESVLRHAAEAMAVDEQQTMLVRQVKGPAEA
jgi:DNA-binding transcriptional ArsR family regulator